MMLRSKVLGINHVLFFFCFQIASYLRRTWNLIHQLTVILPSALPTSSAEAATSATLSSAASVLSRVFISKVSSFKSVTTGNWVLSVFGRTSKRSVLFLTCDGKLSFLRNCEFLGNGKKPTMVLFLRNFKFLRNAERPTLVLS